MIRSPKMLAIALLFSTALTNQKTSTGTKGEGIKHMNQSLELVWSATRENFEQRRQVDFGFSPVHGLTDIDFHSITAREWPAMKTPTPDAVAMLQVVEGTPISQVEEVVRQIAEKGGYKTVVVTVGQ